MNLLTEPTSKQINFLLGYVGRKFQYAVEDYIYTSSNGSRVNSPRYGYELKINEAVKSGTLTKTLALEIIEKFEAGSYCEVKELLKTLGIKFVK